MQKLAFVFTLFFFLCISSANILAASRITTTQHKKILYVDSYHAAYPWSAGITEGIQNVINTFDNIELKIIRMDTKRHSSEEFKKSAALKVRTLIESWQPDVVIASDDNASKYLIVPYYKGSRLPFVFCGVNGDAKVYGFPLRNITGMVEVILADQIIDTMKMFTHGQRISFLKGDDLSARKEAASLEKRLNIHLDKCFVKNFTQWKSEYRRLQDDSDMILLGNTISIANWDAHEARKIIRAETKIPTGGWDAWMAQYELVTYANLPQEQGEWAAHAALAILKGKSPQDIPVVNNKKAKIFLNMGLAKILGIKFSLELLENAHLISAIQKKLFYVNSYHKGYSWSDDIEKGLLKALNITAKADDSFDTSRSEVNIKIFRMDTKLNKSEVLKKKAAKTANRMIDEWRPDIVVASYDNAAKYLLVPYLKKTDTPFVYCGINGDAGGYGLPSRNSTGIIEVPPVEETTALLKKYAKGERLGYIASDTLSARKEIKVFAEKLGIKFSDGKLVQTFPEWQAEYLHLQDSVDMLLWSNPIGIKGWDDKAADDFIMTNTKIPTGATSDNHVRYALLGRVKIAEEQGWWAGKTALKILNGTLPKDIPTARNKESRLYLNMRLAKQMKIKFPMELIEQASFTADLVNIR